MIAARPVDVDEREPVRVLEPPPVSGRDDAPVTRPLSLCEQVLDLRHQRRHHPAAAGTPGRRQLRVQERSSRRGCSPGRRSELDHRAGHVPPSRAQAGAAPQDAVERPWASHQAGSLPSRSAAGPQRLRRGPGRPPQRVAPRLRQGALCVRMVRLRQPGVRLHPESAASRNRRCSRQAVVGTAREPGRERHGHDECGGPGTVLPAHPHDGSWQPGHHLDEARTEGAGGLLGRRPGRSPGNGPITPGRGSELLGGRQHCPR